jgi:hypothetical protein
MISKVKVVLSESGDSFELTVTLTPGAASDGIEIGQDYAELILGGHEMFMPVVGFKKAKGKWSYIGLGPVTSGTFQALSDGSVKMTLKGSGAGLSPKDTPLSIGVRLGDDHGLRTVYVTGTLTYP